MSDEDRRIARDLVELMVDKISPTPGLVMLMIVHENEHGRLETGIASQGGAARTEHGAAMLDKMAAKMRDAVRDALDQFAAENGAEIVERPDLSIDVAGERPRA